MAVLDTLIKKMTLNDQEDEYYDDDYDMEDEYVEDKPKKKPLPELKSLKMIIRKKSREQSSLQR